MIGSFGEVMVMDWGVAWVSGAEEHAAEDTIVGTRGFMSPEQALATADIDQRADVYSLGAVLYLLLTGDVPAVQADAVSAIQHRREFPRALRSICARALASRPDARYATVGELADDVARFRGGFPVNAHKENVAESAIRLARKYRVAILLVLAYMVMRALVAFTVER